MKALKITCPSAVTDTTLRKLENYYGIEFARDSSNGGGDNGYYQMIGDEELLNSLSFHNLIVNGLVKDAKLSATFNQTNWNKTINGNSVSLAGDDGSDVMQVFPTMYAILGGTNAEYERFIISDQPFSYDGDDAIEIKMFGDTPDYETLVDNLARSIYSESVAGTQTATKLTNLSLETDDYQNANGYPRCSMTRYAFEGAARRKNSDTTSNLPYANASCLDLEFIYALLVIECRTKNLNSVFGHGISSNVTPTADTWGTVTGLRFTSADGATVVYRNFSGSVYVNGVSTNVWSLLNGQAPLLKMFEAQRAVSDGATLEQVFNADGEALQGTGNGVMTGIYTKTFSGKLTCGMTSSETASEYTVDVVLRVPVWRGRTRLLGNIWTHASGYEVLNYADEDGTVHNVLFRAPSIAAMTTDSDEVAKTSRTGFGFTQTYDEIGDLGASSGWMKKTLYKNGISVLAATETGAAINNYQSAYTYVQSTGTVGSYVRKTAGLFGGSAHHGSDVFRYCSAYFAPSSSIASFGSGFRVQLTA